jgi:hypothetical protein
MSKRVFARRAQPEPIFLAVVFHFAQARAVRRAKKKTPQIAADYRTFFSRKEIML